MTRDDLFRWMAGHRAPATACARCGRRQIAYYRDYLERPVGLCCLTEGIRNADIDAAAINRRIRQYTHDCPAEGCLVCIATFD